MEEDFKPTTLALQLAENLKKENVRFVNFKSNIHLNKGLAGKTDLDILVYKEDANIFQEVVLKLEFQRVLSPVWSSYPGIEDWIGLDHYCGQLQHLHVHYHILTGLKNVKHLHIPWEVMVFHHLAIDPPTQWPIPQAEVELAILLVRIWAKQPYMKRIWFYTTRRYVIPKDIEDDLIALLRKSDIKELLRILREETNCEIDPEDAQLLEKIKRDGDCTRIGRISKTLNQQLRNNWRASISSVFITALKNRVTLKFANISSSLGKPVHRKKTLSTGGLIIAFIGPDGAGKSTLCNDVTSWLRYKIDTHMFYLGSAFASMPLILKLPLNAYKKSMGMLSRISLRGGDSINFFHKAQKLSLLYVTRRKLNIIRESRRLCLEGSIIIMDRFPQIHQHGINDGPKLQNGECFGWAARTEMSVLKQCTALGPDVVIRLNVSPAVAHQRKPDSSLASLENKTRLIGELTFPHAKIVEIDANNPYEEVLHDIKKEIWRNL